MDMSHMFDDTLDCIQLLAADEDFCKEWMQILELFRCLVEGSMFLLFLSQHVAVDSICGRNHKMFWSYCEEEIEGTCDDACKARSIDCSIQRFRVLGNQMHKYMMRMMADGEKDLDNMAQGYIRINEIFSILYAESHEADYSSTDCLLKMTEHVPSHLVLQLFGCFIQSIWNLMNLNCKIDLLRPEEVQTQVHKEKQRCMYILALLVVKQKMWIQKSDHIPTHFGTTACSLAESILLLKIAHSSRYGSYSINYFLNVDLSFLNTSVVDNLLKTFMKSPRHKDQVAIINREVKLLDTFIGKTFSDDAKSERLDSMLAQIEAKIYNLINTFYSLFWADDIAEELDKGILEFLREVDSVKVEFQDVYPKVPEPIITKMDGIIPLDYFAINLKDLLQSNNRAIDSVKLEVQKIQTKIESLRYFLKNVIGRPYHQYEAQKTHCLDIANAAETMIDSLVANNGPSFGSLLLLSYIMEEIKHVDIEAKEISVETSTPLLDQEQQDQDLYSLPKEMATVVGFEDEVSKIMELLTKGLSEELDVVSIVGMPGLGKTTLAKTIFNHKTIEHKFDVRLFCYVSQIYKKKRLILSMLQQLKVPSNKIDGKSNQDLAHILRQSLLGKRYLIVFDDVWSNEAWDDIVRPLPLQKNGSKLLLTSRDKNVALNAKRTSDPHSLRFFTEDESWELISNIIFKERSCPHELLDIGKQIAKRCEGLPLMTILVAGILKTTDENPSSWDKLAKTFGAKYENLVKDCMDAIGASFKHLPEKLRPCFLYLAAFPKGEVSVQKLLQLWIAERFIPLNEISPAEIIANNFLMDLINRGLIIIAKISSTGEIKTIRIHDLIFDFCFDKAKGGNFLQWLDRVPTFYTNPYLCRLCVNYQALTDVSRLGSPFIRSLLSNQNFSKEVFQELKLLRVIHVGAIDQYALNAICQLFHLRYLSFDYTGTEIPSSIGNLQNLQTFILKAKNGEQIVVSKSILEVVKLKHMHIDPSAMFLLDEFLFDEQSELIDLYSFSTPLLCCNSPDITRKFPNLRKLRCKFIEVWSLERRCIILPNLEHLTKLESFDVTYDGIKTQLPFQFNLPPSIKSLTLSKFCFSWCDICTVASLLPNLEVLKLMESSFEGEEWDMKDECFPNLMFLKLEKLDLVRWSAIDFYEAFPRLEQLVLKWCNGLEEIPTSIGDGSNMFRMIKVQDCSLSLSQLVLEMQEQATDNGLGFEAIILK